MKQPCACIAASKRPWYTEFATSHAVIASEAKQSIAPHKESWIASLRSQ
jgi:hypothetical protein